MREICRWVAAVMVCCVLTGCSSAADWKAAGRGSGREAARSAGKTEDGIPSASRDVFAMDTYMSLTAYGERAEEAVSAAAEEIERLDALLDAEDAGSEVNIVNHSRSEILSDDTAALIQRSIELTRETDGAFDITVYPLMVEWGFTTEKYHVPEKKRIKELLKYVDATKLEYDSGEKMLSLPEHMQIDLGGIAKGYTSGRIMDIFKEYDILSGLVSLGGNVQVYGTKTDGSKWRVGIQDPEDASGYIGILDVADRCVITSGGYERFFKEGGKTWHHILDPSDGYPAESGLASVSIVSRDGMTADGLSTSLFIMGKEKALSYWRAHADDFDVILVEENGTITVSDGIQDDFESDRGFQVCSHSSDTP